MTLARATGNSPAVAFPETPAEARETMREAASRGCAVTFAGGRTEFDLGYPLERLDAVLDATRLNRIVEYSPSDMVATVEAGVTLALLQAELAPRGQRLALDPPRSQSATIGGLIAAGGYGPRRARYGTLRDLIVGISLIRADGTSVRGGLSRLPAWRSERAVGDPASSNRFGSFMGLPPAARCRALRIVHARAATSTRPCRVRARGSRRSAPSSAPRAPRARTRRGGTPP